MIDMQDQQAPHSEQWYIERREHRRHNLEGRGVNVHRWDFGRHGTLVLGEIVDLSSGGVRIRTRQTHIKPDQQIRVRLELPSYAGISACVDKTGEAPMPTNEWVGWMAVTRVQQRGDSEAEVAGRLMDMDELDRGMLSLYLSTQPR